MKDFQVKQDGVGDKLTAAEFNNYIDEAENLVKSSGQTLSEADTNQIGKAVADYVGSGDFFIDSGAANAYVLSAGALKQAPTALVDGLRVRFIPTHTNTGVSTVNLNGFGIKNIKNIYGQDLSANTLEANKTYEMIYDLTNGYFKLKDSTNTGSSTTAVQTSSYALTNSWENVPQFSITVTENGIYDLLARCVLYTGSTGQNFNLALAINNTIIDNTRVTSRPDSANSRTPISLPYNGVSLVVGDVVTLQAKGYAGGSWEIYYQINTGEYSFGFLQITKRGG